MALISSHRPLPRHGQSLYKIASAGKALFRRCRPGLPVSSGACLVGPVDDRYSLAVFVGRVLDTTLIPAKGMRYRITLQNSNTGSVDRSFVWINAYEG